MKLDKISTEDLILELSKRENVNRQEVFEGNGYKLRLPCNKILKGLGKATILICKGGH